MQINQKDYHVFYAYELLKAIVQKMDVRSQVNRGPFHMKL